MMRARTLGAMLALGAMAGAGGCGSEEAGVICGPGTHEEGGQCVADSTSGPDSGEPDGIVGEASVEDAGGEPDATPEPICAKNGRCPTVEMVTVSWPNDEKPPYEIDAWETTTTNYDEFLKDVYDGIVPKPSESWCEKMDGFDHPYEPDPAGGLAICGYSETEAERPVAGVTWCAARAYCSWAGKRLCSEPPDSGAAPSGEWYNACSEGRADPDGAKNPDGCTVATPCEDAPGLYNMSGGVFEHVDACDQSTEMCRYLGNSLRGGQCGATGADFLAFAVVGCVGIRCCR